MSSLLLTSFTCIKQQSYVREVEPFTEADSKLNAIVKAIITHSTMISIWLPDEVNLYFILSS